MGSISVTSHFSWSWEGTSNVRAACMLWEECSAVCPCTDWGGDFRGHHLKKLFKITEVHDPPSPLQGGPQPKQSHEVLLNALGTYKRGRNPNGVSIFMCDAHAQCHQIDVSESRCSFWCLGKSRLCFHALETVMTHIVSMKPG